MPEQEPATIVGAGEASGTRAAAHTDLQVSQVSEFRDRVRITHWPDNVTDAYFSSGTVDGDMGDVVLRPNGISRTITIKCTGDIGRQEGGRTLRAGVKMEHAVGKTTSKSETATVCLPWSAQPSATITVSSLVEGSVSGARIEVTYSGAGGPFYLYAWDSHGYAISETHYPGQYEAIAEFLDLREIPGIQGGRQVGVMLLNKDYGLVAGPSYEPVGDNGN